jgi:membrane-bound lytic murein transglycosylase D
MSFALCLSFYLTLNALLAVGFLTLAGVSRLFRRSAHEELKLHYAMLTLIFVFSLSPFLFSSGNIFSPPVKIWSASSMQTFNLEYTPTAREGILKIPLQTEGIRVNYASLVMGLWAGTLFLLALYFISRDVLSLVRLRRQAVLIRQIGRVQISVHDEIEVPFSFWLPAQAHVVLPSRMLAGQRHCQMAVAHELQHHRQGDTRWVFVLWAVKWFCFLNPFIYLWIYKISEVQELACDETLVDLKKVESQAYASCLVEVAETALLQKRHPIGAMGMAFLAERNLLKRRISKMLYEPANRIKRKVTVGLGVLVATVLGFTASAAKDLVQDRRVSMAQAQTMATNLKGSSGFPVAVNDRVLRQLNRYVGTPEGREFMKASLKRMETYRSLVEENLRKYSMPMELLAVPIVESGYQNLPQKPGHRVKSAGLWQFIPSTARIFGLTVTAEKDERLDVARETDAAMRYLKANRLRFDSWLLSLLAYNMGEEAVQKGIEATGSRDVWELIRAGHEGDQNYLAKVMAAILIMKNPEILD